MRNKMTKLGLFFLTCAFSVASASGAVITSLPGGTSLPIPSVNLLGEFGPQNLAPGVVFTSTEPSAYGWTGGYGFSTNGFWSGPPMIGLDTSSGFFDITFATPIAGFLGELNWTVDQNLGVNSSISIYDSFDNLLESLVLENDANLVTPGYWGFLRATADISKVRFSEEFIGVRDITTTLSTNAVPEPTSCCVFGAIGLIGCLMRRRRTN